MNIYFICTGNTCRSPMAEAILKNKNIPNIAVRSAGIYALDGGEMSENSQTVLLQENIEYNHLSSQVTRADIEWADLILTMTAAHKEMIIRTYDGAQSKIFTLKEYATPYSGQDVFDPFGGGLSTYKQTYEELKRLLNELEIKIKKVE